MPKTWKEIGTVYDIDNDTQMYRARIVSREPTAVIVEKMVNTPENITAECCPELVKPFHNPRVESIDCRYLSIIYKTIKIATIGIGQSGKLQISVRPGFKIEQAKGHTVSFVVWKL